MRIYGAVLLCFGVGVQLVGNLLKIVSRSILSVFSSGIGSCCVGGKNFDLYYLFSSLSIFAFFILPLYKRLLIFESWISYIEETYKY